MNPVSEALCKTTDAIDYHEFTDLATDRIYYGRVRANFPYSSTSDWVYVTANEQPAMLMASVGILELDPKLTLNAATGSTLTYEWSYTEDAATDATRLYNIELFRDEACSELHVSWLADGKLASDKGIFTALAGYPVVRFTFSGLDPETTYYARVTNASFGNIMTPVVAGTTAKAGPEASPNNPAQAGDIVLAQDFAAFIHGGDIVRSAAGYNAVSGTDYRKAWEPATGENPQADGDRPVCNWATEFHIHTGGTSAEYVESLGMTGWGSSGNTSTRPGYIKCGGGGGGIGILYTPELAALPKNTTVTVSFSASAYAEGENVYGSDIVVEAIEGAEFGSNNSVSKKGTAVASKVVDISSAVGRFETFTVTLDGLSPTSRIAFSSNPAQAGANKTRYLLDDIVVVYDGETKLEKLTVPANVKFDAEAVYSDKLTLEWDEVPGAASYTVAWWADGTEEKDATVAEGITSASYLLKELEAGTGFGGKPRPDIPGAQNLAGRPPRGIVRLRGGHAIRGIPHPSQAGVGGLCIRRPGRQTAGSGNGVRTVLLRQPGEQGVEGRVCQEIVDHDQRSAMSRSGDPPGQHGLADNDVGIGGNAVRGTVADHHADARIGEPFSKPRGTQRTRPHARIAGENHLADMCREVLRGLYGGRPALRGGDCACRHILRGGGTPDEGRRHEQRHRRGDQHSGQHDEGLAFGSHGQHRNDAAGRSRRHQSGPGKRKEQQPGGTARNRGEDQRRARQDIGKIDFVDTAAELDDYGAGRRLAHIAAAEKPAGQQYAQPGAWIRFQQEHDRLPGFAGLLDADRREDAVVQGIIEEQHLGRLDQKRHERQQSVADHDLHAVADQQRQPRHRTADDPIAQYGQQHTEDAYREIAHEHLEARLYASLRKFVEPPDRIPAQRAHDHGSDEHRDIAADDDAHGGNGPDYPAAFAGDVAPGRIGDQQRQQVGQHRVDQACHLGVGPPSRGDEERRDESPRDERADVGHDHAAQGPAEFLYLLSHSFLSCI